MNWLLGPWLPVWRAHRWVFAVWLLAVFGVVVEIANVVASGFDSLTLSAALLWVLVIQGFHQWIVARYERRALRA